MRQRQALERAIAGYRRLERELDDAVTLIELGEAEGDAPSVDEGEAGAARARRGGAPTGGGSPALGRGGRQRRLFGDARRGRRHRESGLGRACSSRMYIRWAEDRGYKVSLVEESEGEEAGIKSATLVVKGENAYGWLKTEIGRASAGAHFTLRQQCASAHRVLPASGSTRWSMRTSRSISRRAIAASIPTAPPAPGGQHVNTTDSAVRITHIPTNIVVASQQERSQIKNRAIAWAMLKSRLYEQELKRREEKANAAAASKTEIGWGHQIRSYVMQPYQLVKDLQDRHAEQRSTRGARR